MREAAIREVYEGLQREIRDLTSQVDSKRLFLASFRREYPFLSEIEAANIGEPPKALKRRKRRKSSDKPRSSKPTVTEVINKMVGKVVGKETARPAGYFRERLERLVKSKQVETKAKAGSVSLSAMVSTALARIADRIEVEGEYRYFQKAA